MVDGIMNPSIKRGVAMKKFLITFRMVDHFNDEAGYPMPLEQTIVESPCNMTATMEFCTDMKDERFVIESVEEIK